MLDSETGVYKLEKDKPLILLIGGVANEGIVSNLQATNRQYKQKLLESKPENWEKICKYFDDYKVEGTLIKITPYIITLMTKKSYEEVTKKLLHILSKKPHIVFIYEDLMSMKIEEDEWVRSNFKHPTDTELKTILELFSSFDLNLLPYKKNSEVTVLAQSFLEDTENNLIFRVYVPSGRVWAIEGDKLLLLFKDYLSNIGHYNIRLDQQRTDKGIIYEFHGDEPKGEHGLATEFDEFTEFMDLCANNQDGAKELLVQKNIDHKVIYEILSRYGKEAKRLQVDIKHERERKLLSIQQRLESELTDGFPVDTDWNLISKLVDQTIPPFSGINSPFSISNNNQMVTTNNNYTVNLKPQIIDTVNGVIAQEINGNQTIGVDGQQLIQLVNKYGEEKAQELVTAIYELEDKKVPKSDRLKAGQKLKRFLIEVGKKTSDVALGVLQSYIENKLGL